MQKVQAKDGTQYILRPEGLLRIYPSTANRAQRRRQKHKNSPYASAGINNHV